MSETEIPRVLPSEVRAELIAALGSGAVATTEQELADFRDPYWPEGDDSYAASAVVFPGSTEEVRDVMRIATRYGIPVWPHSQGRNYGYGGASPRVAGSIQISLRRMNRILEIDESMAYAVVEPGVTWFELHAALEERAPSLMHSVPDLGWGSVVGNSMDSGITYQPYGADYQSPCGFEVVLPDGDLLRTGPGAIPEGRSWHLYKRGLGPPLDSLFVQSNLGIVTRMGVWLTRKPEAYAPLRLVIDDDGDLEAAIDTIRELRLDGHLDGVPTLYPPMRAAVMLNDTTAPVGVAADPDDSREKAAMAELGAWATRTAIWGDRVVVDHHVERIRQSWSAIASGRVELGRIYGPHEYGEIQNSAEQIQAGIPNLRALELAPDHFAHVGFSPVVPLVGSEVRRVVDDMRQFLDSAGEHFTGSIMVTNERSCVILAGLRFDRRDEVAAVRAYRIAKGLVTKFGAWGYGEYRAHLDFMDLAAQQYSFNDHAYRRFVEKIKDAVDPSGVLSPGRHGVWPARDRRP